jgi:[ribosomal protein S18]-alanine N-acetyltransferase
MIEPLTFTPMCQADARAIRTWHYEGPYAVYNPEGDDPDEAVAEMLDPRSPYFAARDARGELVGFFCFGTCAEVGGDVEPGLYGPDNVISVGLGMRPDLTGRGLGPAFVEAGLAFARQRFAPAAFRLFVFTFNRRAIRVYERVGFRPVRTVVVHGGHGQREFLEMLRPA